MFLPLAILTLLLSFVASKPCCTLVPPKSINTFQSSTSSSSGSGAGGPGAGGDAVTAAAYYPSWLANYSPSDIPWSKYNSLIFAFAVTTSSSPYYDLLGEDDNLKSFVSAAHSNSVNASLSVGGWTGSVYFSQIFASQDSRNAFVDSMVDLVNTYQLDGLDFDWEYPGSTGAGCNTNSPSDVTNFLQFLTSLRSKLGPNIVLSAPVAVSLWQGAQDVSQFANVLDHIMIMNYDVWGSWSTGVGPNAPLNDTCASAQDKQGSAVSAVQLWSNAGIPPTQIVLGLAAYGHSFDVQANVALQPYPPFDKSNQPLGPDDTPSSLKRRQTGCGGGGDAGPSGIFNFAQMIQAGYLSSDGGPANGMQFRFDNCSQTAYVYNPKTSVMISYDNTDAWAAKGTFINAKGLKGFAVWDVSGDSTNDLLLTSVWDAMGLERECS